MFKKIISVIMTVTVISVCFCTCFTAYAAEHNTDKIMSYIDSIISYKLNYEKQSSVQALIDNVFVKQAGLGAEWYVLSLRQYKYSSLDYSKYTSALKNYVSDPSAGNPVEKEKCALVLSCLNDGQAYTVDVIENSTGKLGLMSYVYSLHLLNLGFNTSGVTKSSVISAILERQLSDGGWAVSGNVSDVDATAMTVQALSQNLSDGKVKAAAEKAILLLSRRSDADNEYSSYGIANGESTAQVIIALSSMGIDCCKDSRFIKNGKTLIDVLLSYKCDDGAYAHTHNDNGSPYPTVQALMAYISYYRLLNSQSSIYKFPVSIQPVQTSPSTTKETVHSQAAPSKEQANIGEIINRLDIFGLLSGDNKSDKETVPTENVTVDTTTAVTTTSTTASTTAEKPETTSHSETTGVLSTTQPILSESSTEVSSQSQPASGYEEALSVTQQEISSESESPKRNGIYIVMMIVTVLLAASVAVVIYRKKK